MAWYIVPYQRRNPGETPPQRYCAMDDFTELIRADPLSGEPPWAETEVLGDSAIVKVRAGAATLATLNAAPGFVRIPLARLDDPLSTLTAGQRTAIRDRILALGYPLAELQAAIPDLSTVTLGDALRFACRRRLKSRYDAASDLFVLDGAVQPVRPLDHVDAAVA